MPLRALRCLFRVRAALLSGLKNKNLSNHLCDFEPGGRRFDAAAQRRRSPFRVTPSIPRGARRAAPSNPSGRALRIRKYFGIRGDLIGNEQFEPPTENKPVRLPGAVPDWTLTGAAIYGSHWGYGQKFWSKLDADLDRGCHILPKLHIGTDLWRKYGSYVANLPMFFSTSFMISSKW
jgi:hypothetical protein